MSDQRITNLEIQTAKAELQLIRTKLELIRQQFRPSMCLPVCIRRDGRNWMCIYESSENFLECPCAYGNSPAEAMINFDNIWSGLGLQIDLEEEDEEF